MIVETAPKGSYLGFPDIPDAIDALPELFARAEKTIDLSQMYLLYYPQESKGSLIYALYDGLIAAAQRGVRVRILVDSLTLEQNTSRTYGRMPGLLREVPGIEVRACDLRPYSTYSGCMLHAKYCLVDGWISVIGSHNWSFAAFADNRELSLVVSDTGLGSRLGAVFETDWQAAAGRMAQEEGLEAKGQKPEVRSQNLTRDSGRFRLVVSAPKKLGQKGMLSTVDALKSLFGRAESSLSVQVNSFSTRVDFGDAERFGLVESLLRASAGRGVRVRLLVDKWSFEHEPGLFLALDSVENVEVKVGDIASLGPNEKTGTMHAKVAIADRKRALVGSATFSQRQIVECRNVGVLVDDAPVASELARVFERDWAAPCSRPPDARR